MPSSSCTRSARFAFGHLATLSPNSMFSDTDSHG